MGFALKAILLSLSLGALAAPKYPITVFQRPFTMPKNAFESVLSFSNDNIMKLGADYGVTDSFQMGFDWGGLDMSNSPSKKISLNAAHYLFSTPYASSMATFSMPFYFSKMVLQSVTLGMPTSIPIVRGHVSWIVFEDLITLDWLENVYSNFQFGTRISWQATPSLYFSLGTSLGTLNTLDENTHIFQTTPIKLGVIYAVTPMVDLIGSLKVNDLQQSKTTEFIATLGVVFRGGNIEG